MALSLLRSPPPSPKMGLPHCHRMFRRLPSYEAYRNWYAGSSLSAVPHRKQVLVVTLLPLALSSYPSQGQFHPSLPLLFVLMRSIFGEHQSIGLMQRNWKKLSTKTCGMNRRT